MGTKEAAHPLEGKKAPAFALESESGDKVRLSALQGNLVVLYFYPKDNTPGCTMEAKEFRDAAAAFAQAGAVVLGVSPDSVASHCTFTEKHGLNFTLLSDPDHVAAEKYGVWVEKNMYGRKYMGIQRATFLIGKTGRVCRVWPKVKPKGHAREVLDAIAAVQND